jgi:acyl-CoA hydrolase
MVATYGMGYRSTSENKLAIATSDVKVKKPLRSGKIVEVYQDVVWVWQRNCERVDVAKIDKDALLQAAQERVVRSIAA